MKLPDEPPPIRAIQKAASRSGCPPSQMLLPGAGPAFDLRFTFAGGIRRYGANAGCGPESLSQHFFLEKNPIRVLVDA